MTNLIQHPMRLLKKFLPGYEPTFSQITECQWLLSQALLKMPVRCFSAISPHNSYRSWFSRGLTVLILAKALKGAEMKSFLLYLSVNETWKNKSWLLKPLWNNLARQITNSGHEVHRCRPSCLWTWAHGHAVLVVTMVNCHFKGTEQTLSLWLCLWLL